MPAEQLGVIGPIAALKGRLSAGRSEDGSLRAAVVPGLELELAEPRHLVPLSTFLSLSEPSCIFSEMQVATGSAAVLTLRTASTSFTLLVLFLVLMRSPNPCTTRVDCRRGGCSLHYQLGTSCVAGHCTTARRGMASVCRHSIGGRKPVPVFSSFVTLQATSLAASRRCHGSPHHATMALARHSSSSCR